ncbi:hypothetical protein DN062_09690 [Nitrincola tibetensis]|uniref:F0F1 ATP synthase assembly protein I n=1 Tax=Nitrincola tibetensis TaxID=2219697 RepID=A0A364NLW5_9GAMM|nr:ATP synthase subunit I [Nitrincola tibetensis]RAU18051.1 hypothetical protein DN062_09690 [Nitrincola tibetensis]
MLEKPEESGLNLAGVRSRVQGSQGKVVAQAFAKVLLIQVFITSALSLALIFKDFVAAYSAFIGGMLYLIPTAYFTLKVQFKNNAHTAKEILANVYMSQFGKMVLAIALFSLTFMMVEPLNPLSLFVTFILMQISGWYLQFKLNNRFLKR